MNGRACLRAASFRTRLRAGGFTLIEVLVALAILALTAVLAWQATAALVDGELRLSSEATRWRALDQAFARLEADLRQAQPRAVRTPAGSEAAWIGATEAHGGSAIVFSRAGPEFESEPGAAGQRIAYRLRDGALEVVYWPTLDRPRDDSTAYRLIDDIAGFRVDHFASTGEWVSAWPRFGEATLPRAVRVMLTLASGETIERLFALQ
jgi:general secretion pathway protein J